MKKKISILLVIIGLVSTGMLMANGGKGGFGFFEKIAEELSLTNEQKSDIEPIVDKYKALAEELKEKEFEDRGEKREAFKDLKQRAKSEILPLLTTEQVAKWEELKSMHRGGKHHRHGKGFKGNKELKDEMKVYFDKEILPIAKQERAKLESVISREDKAIIDALRVKMNEIKAVHKAEKEERMKQKEEWMNNKDSEKSKAEREEWRKQREARKAECEGNKEQCRKEGRRKGHRGHHGHHNMDEQSRVEVEGLIEKYKGDIEPLLKGMKTQYGETWENDIKAIVKKHAPEMEGKFKDSGGKGRMNKPLKKALNPIGFLLLDPNAESFTQMEVSTDLRKIKVYPNPAENSTTVAYEVLEEGTVTIGIYDRKGNLVKNVFDQNQKPGEYTNAVDLTGLDDRVYIIRINDVSGQLSQRLMKK